VKAAAAAPTLYDAPQTRALEPAAGVPFSESERGAYNQRKTFWVGRVCDLGSHRLRRVAQRCQTRRAATPGDGKSVSARDRHG